MPELQTFSLTELIEEHLVDDPEVDPSVIATRVANDIPEDQLRSVIADLLQDAVRVYAGEMRRKLMKNARQESNGDQENFSQKWSEAKKVIGKLDFSRHRICLPDNTWVFFGDMTYESLLAVANSYEKRAEENLDQRDRYIAVADLLKKNRKKFVRELDQIELKKIFND